MEPAKSGSHELSQGWLITHSSAQLSPEQGELRSPSLSMFLGIPLLHGQKLSDYTIQYNTDYTIPDSVNISSAAGTETPPAKVRIQFITTLWSNSQVTTGHCQIKPPSTFFQNPCAPAEALPAPKPKSDRKHIPFPSGRQISLQMGNLQCFLSSMKKPGELCREDKPTDSYPTEVLLPASEESGPSSCECGNSSSLYLIAKSEAGSPGSNVHHKFCGHSKSPCTGR